MPKAATNQEQIAKNTTKKTSSGLCELPWIEYY